MKPLMLTLPLLLLAGTASAGDFGDRVQHRFERHGDRIDNRLDRRGEHIDRRWDRRH